MFSFSISDFNEAHNYTADWLKWISRKFLQNEKIFHLGIYIVELVYTDTSPPFKMEIRIVYTEANVCKDTKNHEVQSWIVAFFNFPV